jgi:hypothetical protein
MAHLYKQLFEQMTETLGQICELGLSLVSPKKQPALLPLLSLHIPKVRM